MGRCPQPQEIQAYVDRELTGTEAALLAAHLHSCPHCQQIHDSLLLISQALSARPRPRAREDLLELTCQAVDSAPHVPRISCKRARALISPHLDGELSPTEQLLLWRHVFACEQCYQQLKQTEQVTEALHQHTRPVPVSADLAGRIHDAVAADRAQREVGIIRPARWGISRRAIGVAATGVASAAALIIGLLLVPETPPTQTPRIVELPAEVALPAAESIVPEVKQPTVAGPELAEPKPAVRPHRPRGGVVARKPKRGTAAAERGPATTRSGAPPARESTTLVPQPEMTTVMPATGAAELTPAGPVPPQPATPAAPPTDTDDGARLALTPSAPAGEPTPRIRDTPVAGTTQVADVDTGALPESVLAAASREVNERAARGISYAARPEITLK